MNIITDIQQTLKNVLSDTATGFGTECIFSVVSGVTVLSKTCGAIVVKHNRSFDDIGAEVSSPTVRVTVSELALKALNYPVRNSADVVSMKGHRVTFTDVDGFQATYTVVDQFPNAQTGAIRLQMASFAVPSPPGRTIIGWIVGPVAIQLRPVPNGTMQTLANGEQIPLQYVINPNGTLTIPGIAGFPALTPFLIMNMPIMNMPYTQSTGTFNNAANNGFVYGSNCEVNVSLPLYAD
jgi:hypothetical protein